MKTYKILHVDGMLLAVDETRTPNDWENCLCTYNDKSKNPYMGVYFSWKITGVDNKYPIVAYNPLSTGKILEGVPLLPDHIEQWAYKLSTGVFLPYQDRADNKVDLHTGLKREGFVEGYKAAGGYTIEDIRNAFQAGVVYQHGERREYDGFGENSKPDWEEYKKSLTKYPTAIEVDESLPVDQMFKQGRYIYEKD